MRGTALEILNQDMMKLLMPVKPAKKNESLIINITFDFVKDLNPTYFLLF
jgi:hypothetical protein